MKIWRNRAVGYVTVIIIVILSYIVFGNTGALQNKSSGFRIGIFIAMLAGMALLIIKYAGIRKQREFAEEQLIAILVCMGILMRIDYMLYTPCNIRSHDLWEIDVNSYGHAAYLLKVMQGHLPESNAIQLYQQPLFYILAAVLSGMINAVLQINEAFYLVDAAKTVSCIVSCTSLMICREIFRECGLKGRGMIRAMMIVTFLPVYYLTGGMVGPDALAGMFMLLAFLYTCKWMKNKTWKNTVILAITFGLGMMTKISCASLALFTALIFVYSFIKGCKDGSWKSLLAKYAVFGMISLPLGLWYSVRNYYLFHQPFSYVLEIGKDNVLYTGNQSIFQRIFVVKLQNLFANPYADVCNDYNLPVYALKSSLFGEFRFESAAWLPEMLLFCAGLLAVCSVAAIVYQIGFSPREQDGRLCLLAAGIFYTSIVIFYLKYPFGCSMDFRYMLFLPAPIAVLLGKCGWYGGDLGRYVDILCIGFAITSCLMFV